MASRRKRRQREANYHRHKNQSIDHLVRRFKERFDIDLTRERRRMLLRQIAKGVAKCTYVGKNFALWRVYIYNQETFKNDHFTVVYKTPIKEIVTVLPRIDSEEFNEFCKVVEKKYGITREDIIKRQLTSDEKTESDIETSPERILNHRIEVNKERLKKHFEEMEGRNTLKSRVKENVETP